MVNSVNSYNTLNHSSFSNITTHSDADYWLDKMDRPLKILPENPLGSILPEQIILNPEEARKTNNIKTIGISIASATVIAAATIFFVLKGGPKGITKGFQVLRDFYERKLQKSKLTGINAPRYEYILGKIDYLLDKLQAINNFTTIKDFAFKKLMYGGNRNWNYTGKVHNRISHMFERLGLKTVANSYSKTFSKFDNLNKINMKVLSELEKGQDLSTKITINGIKLPKSEWIKLAKEMSTDIDKQLKDNFNDSARISRYRKIKRMTKELEQSFDQKGSLWFLSKDTLKTFVADAAMLPKKLKIQDDIKNAKFKISHSAKDTYRDADEIIMKISSTLNYGDKKALDSLNAVRENFKLYAKTGEIDNQKMIKDLYNLKYNIRVPIDSKINTFDLVQKLNDLFIHNERGIKEHLLEIYKELLPKEQYEKIAKEYSKALKSLDKSIKLETDDFINKSRDLAMGSAPTDILTVLGGLGTLVYYLGKSDNGQERTAITLKYGIPALVGIGASLYGNARLFAGSKSLAFATISSIIANRIGTFANNLYENHLKKTGKFIERNKQNT